jgi:hypothetical protein
VASDVGVHMWAGGRGHRMESSRWEERWRRTGSGAGEGGPKREPGHRARVLRQRDAFGERAADTGGTDVLRSKSLIFRTKNSQIALGVALGLLLAVQPPYVFIPLFLAIVIVVCTRACIVKWTCDVVAVLAMLLALTTCHFLPTKQLDVKVGPIAYPDMPLSELCTRLYQDYGIHCFVWDLSARTDRLTFSTPCTLSRRRVLEKLSHDTDRPLRIGYCGSEASILFGASPSFTTLGPKRLSDDTDDTRPQEQQGVKPPTEDAGPPDRK